MVFRERDFRWWPYNVYLVWNYRNCHQFLRILDYHFVFYRILQNYRLQLVVTKKLTVDIFEINSKIRDCEIVATAYRGFLCYEMFQINIFYQYLVHLFHNYNTTSTTIVTYGSLFWYWMRDISLKEKRLTAAAERVKFSDWDWESEREEWQRGVDVTSTTARQRMMLPLVISRPL